jgi:hypothetical protein
MILEVHWAIRRHLVQLVSLIINPESIFIPCHSSLDYVQNSIILFELCLLVHQNYLVNNSYSMFF